MTMVKAITILITSILLFSCGKKENQFNTIFRSDTLGVQKSYFEKKYGLAKKIYDKTYEYEIDGCQINITYGKNESIISVEMPYLSEKCNFDAGNFELEGNANNLIFKDLTADGLTKYWDPEVSCLSMCGASIEPSFGIASVVRDFRGGQSSYVKIFARSGTGSSENDAADAIEKYFKNKFPEHDMNGDTLGPIDITEYKNVWIQNVGAISIKTFKFSDEY